MSSLEILPDARGRWRVFDDAAPGAPLSEHASATDAELAARSYAATAQADTIVVHDRYNRTRVIPTGAARRRPRPARW